MEKKKTFFKAKIFLAVRLFPLRIQTAVRLLLITGVTRITFYKISDDNNIVHYLYGNFMDTN